MSRIKGIKHIIWIAILFSRVAMADDAVYVTIERVLDGDTVAVKSMRQHVRLANIDAPESSHGYGKPGQPFNQSSTQHLEALLSRGQVRMACYDEDRYQRAVCEFFVGNASINKQMVLDGMAWANTSAKGRYLRDHSYVIAQVQAQTARRGLWSQPAIEPWNWRSDCWKDKVCPLLN